MTDATAAPTEQVIRVPDPHGVRVSVVLGSAEDPAPIVVEPPAVAVIAAPRITGRGLLGGLATTDGRRPERHAATPAAGPVLVDGQVVEASLVMLDAEHGVLAAPRDGTDGTGPAGTRVLLLPPGPAASGSGATTAARGGAVRREVVVDGWRIELEVESAARAALRERARRGREEAGHSGPTEVHAIIPGVVVSVSVAPGDAVVAGQQLLAVEAMKMQNELRAPRDGTIERVAVAPGRTIEVGDLLLVIT
jgi:biotin carboxyl carrier protein